MRGSVMHGRATRLLTTLLATPVALGTLVAGCGLQSAAGYIPPVEGDSIKHYDALEGDPIRVTSKELTEQIILGKIAVLALDAAGFEVQDQTEIHGSDNARRSMLAGENDLMWEYTGTAWLVYEGKPNIIKDPREQYEAIRDHDAKQNDMAWLDPPAPMSNSYAIVVKPETAKKYGLKAISDLDKIPEKERSLCMDTEFANRDDGLPQLDKEYGLPKDEFSSTNVMSAGVVYPAVSDGECTLGSAYSTDARIQALGLTLLRDDKKSFPIYNPTINVKEDFAERYPQLPEIFAPIAKKLDNETITRLNIEVDEKGEEPIYVARDWMIEEGFITKGDSVLAGG